MIEKVYKLGLEKFAGDESKAQAFVDGFLKEASAGAMYGQVGGAAAKAVGSAASKIAPSIGHTISDNLLKAVGAGIGTFLVGAGIHGIASSMKDSQHAHTREAFEKALRQAIDQNSILRDSEPARVRQYAETIFKFAPNVSTDVNLLQTILAHAIHGQGMDPNIIKTLTDLESQFQRTVTTPAFSPKSYI